MLNPLPVVIRTMDLGGDKVPLFHHIGADKTFRAGLRGLAYSLTEKTMFLTQLRAILRAAGKGNVRIMFPMIMGTADLMEGCYVVDEAMQNEHIDKRPLVGAMIETPAAAFDIYGILDIVDFVCIGTNDLSHFILAMDRGVQGDSAVHSFLHPAVLRATDHIVKAAIKKNVPVSVCGEAAGDPGVACFLVGIGVRELSMSPFLSSRVCRSIRRLTLEQAGTLAGNVLEAETQKEIQGMLSSALYGIVL